MLRFLLGRDSIASRRRAAYRLLCIALLALAVLAPTVLGCGSDYRSLKVKTGPTKDLRLGAVWDALAEQGEFDGETATFQSLWLEYSPKGILLSGRFQTWTDGPRLLQVGFFSGDPSGEKPVQITGSLCIADHAVAVTLYALAVSVFRAIDLVGPSNMIALMEPAGNLGRYVLTSAYEWTIPLQPIEADVAAYRWDGARFVEVGPNDKLREFAGGYEYLVGYSSKLVSSTSTDNMTTSEYRGSDKRVYFLIPTPGR